MIDENSLKEISEAFAEIEQKILDDQDNFWDSLSKDQQLLAFCKIMRILKQAEIDEKRSYRGVLYDSFGFGIESYMAAQLSGFLEIHNSIKVE